MPRRARAPKPKPLTARSADKYALYQLAVQEPDAELDFLQREFRKRHQRSPVHIREDFSASALVCATWVKRRAGNRATAVDLDPEPLDYCRRVICKDFTPEQRSRLELITENVLSPKLLLRDKPDAILATNFSYWVFKRRADMLAYYRNVRKALAPGGLFILDFFGGSEVLAELTERRRIKGATYVWDQHSYDPVTGDYTCHIHFEFRDGTRLNKAFTYHWRLWTLPELQEILTEAGFAKVTVYWEGDDGKGGGNGVFRPVKRGVAERSFIAYLVAE
jgi:SAM-dependent methyltransferase